MTSASALDGKVAVVTGSSKGIGRALAIGLGQAGANVVVNYKNDRAGTEQTCRRVQEAGGIAVAVSADVGVPENAQQLIDTAHRELGSVDVLVNNAARVRLGPARAVIAEDWDDAINTNLRGAFLTTMAAVAAMGERGGSIINISTCAATLMLRYHSVYTASKGGLEAMTRGARAARAGQRHRAHGNEHGAQLAVRPQLRPQLERRHPGSYMTADEAIEQSVEMVDPISAGNWFDKYEWQSARVD
ncbi:SDR family NAD(P)-dependent oxidoreductase [Candidatus Protofrankia californiensis]|uniref:SDR family NAD(P)-dependent oxidoreductase n=1 Tax=Candidatus Protofrankia californiensis TaxID=1839754 RepID=UPI0013ECCB80|nr:SDR family NAD(P)-dependent oxidoreductase [Candidatus Protofrankia californiensis]